MMRRGLALVLACVLLAQTAAGSSSGRNKLLGRFSVRKLLQGGSGTGSGSGSGSGTGSGTASGTGTPKSPSPSPSSSKSPSPSPSGGKSPSSVPSTAGVYTTISVGDTSVVCDKWDESIGSWDTPSGATEYTTKGKAVPQTSQVSQIQSQICSNPKSASQGLKTALQAGGSQAEAWVYALFNADCSSDASDTYQYAIDSVNTGNPADLAATKAFFTAFAKAADAVGIPVCATVALVDEADGSVKEQTYYHTG